MNKVLIYDVIKSIEVNNKIFNNFKNSNDFKIVQSEINKYYIESGFEELPFIEITLTSNQKKNAEKIIIYPKLYGDKETTYDIESYTLIDYLLEDIPYRFNALSELNKDINSLPSRMDKYEMSARLEDINCEYFQRKEEIMEELKEILIGEDFSGNDNISIKLNHYRYTDEREPNIDFKIEQYIEDDIMYIIEKVIYDEKSYLSTENLKNIFENNANLKLIKYLLQKKYNNQIDNCNYIYALNKYDSFNIYYKKTLIELKDYKLEEQYKHADKYAKELTQSDVNLDLQSFLTLKLNKINCTIKEITNKIVNIYKEKNGN
jgi:hypothetical protein